MAILSGGKAFNSVISVKDIIDFLELGGNAFVATGSVLTDLVKQLAIEFSVDFDDTMTEVRDAFENVQRDGKSSVKSDNYHAFAAKVLSTGDKKPFSSAIDFSGIAHRLTGKNGLGFPVLMGSNTCYSVDKTLGKGVTKATSPFVGRNVVLASVLETVGHSRISFFGSVDALSDAYGVFFFFS